VRLVRSFEDDMAKSFFGSVGLLSTVVLLSTLAAAQKAPQAPDAAPAGENQKHLHNYGSIDPTCIRWTDQCRTCNRSTDEGEPGCSNIGIACQPKEVECLERRRAEERK
jgi:hypothetical protein